MQDVLKYIKDSLSDLYPAGEASILSRIIAESVTGLHFTMLANDKNNKISLEQKQRIDEVIIRLKKSEPIQYILGETEFHGLRFVVNENVLIPRPETEELVELIVNENKGKNSLNILDIGTGSGCIAIALKKHLPTCNLTAWDISVEALNVARQNAVINNVDVNFMQVDVLGDVPNTQYDIIVSNPPYILESEKQDMEDNVLNYEPHLALFVPDDKGLMFYERIADIAKLLLKPGGKLYFEINASKGVETVKMAEGKGFKDVVLITDLSGNDRIVKALLK